MTTNLRKRPLDASAAEKLEVIYDAIDAILKKTMSRYSFQRVHHSVFQMCQGQHSSVLFERVEEVLSTQVTNIRDRLLRAPEQTFLCDLNTEWEDFRLAVSRISEALLYLNNNYTSRRQTIPQMGDNLFCMAVLKNNDLSNAFAKCVGKILTADMDSRNALKELSARLRELYKDTLYEPLMEDPLIGLLTDCYRKKMEVELKRLDTVQYLMWTSGTIEEVRSDVSELVGRDTGQRVEHILGLLLIKENTEKLLYTDSVGGASMVRNMDKKSLRSLGEALERVNESEAFFDMIVATAKRMGSEILGFTDHVPPVLAVEKVLELRYKLEELVLTLPGVGTDDRSPVSRALREIVNDNPGFAEKLAYYYDAKIRLRPPDEALKQIAFDTFSLFRLIRSKDTFEHVLKVLLAGRLIYSKPEESLSHETYLIEYLRNECGDSVVNHLETMIKDGRMRTEINRLFFRSLSTEANFSWSFNAFVITAGVWPQYSNVMVSLPESMQRCMHLFKSYYLRRHNGRKLCFNTNLGTVHFELNHGKTYEIVAPTAFASTILCFQDLTDDQRLTLQEICQTTELLENDALSHLESLSQMGLITAEDSSGVSQYMFNHDFTHPKTKLRLRTANTTKSFDDSMEPRAHRESLETSHSVNIEAVLVHIMKTKKTMNHAELCARVTGSLQRTGYVPAMADIKQSLEALMGKGLIARGNRPETYIYES
ncbi:putative cullin-like protein [Trypanosoma grayi]|uniref:putative cullin-like protein n=1 Tax=Trypanosoma grayi TaxID=71804 RepID=UPI0004F48AC4|nr:putative cullin-like protein [Trypanosoma grayi]KEG12813.1 putative cullin-like protein [Trypanosoma grayi]